MKGGIVIMFNLKKIPLKIFIVAALLLSSYAYAQYDNSRFVNQSVPSTMVSGGIYTVLVTFENTGSTYWTPYDYKLAIVPGPEARAYSTWGTTTRDLISTVEPGKTVTFEFPVTAPYTYGSYTLQTQLMHSNYYFGQSSYAIVGVGTSPPPPVSLAVNSAAFIDQTVSSTMTAGNTFTATITMTNTGSATWTPGRYWMVNLTTYDNTSISTEWGINRVELNDNVYPGSTKVFSFNVTAPSTSGSYLFQWRMSSSDGGLFGDASSPRYIYVENRTTGLIEDRISSDRVIPIDISGRAERAIAD
jgi:hypothetical protein